MSVGRARDAQLLERLRAECGAPALAYREPPHFLGEGSDAAVYGLLLEGTGSDWAVPLVVRWLKPAVEARQVVWDDAVHSALTKLDFPVPRILCTSELDDGSRFQIMTRIPGRMLLEEVTTTPPEELLRRPWRLPARIYEALVLVPRLLAETQVRLHALDTGPLEQELAQRGFALRDFGPEATLAELGRQVENASLDELQPALAWLRERRPRPDRLCICHGDLVFTNLFVNRGRVTGVFDWSKASVGEPAFDVAATLSRLDSRVPGLPAVLRWLQHAMARRYLAAYSALGSLAPDALRYYEAMWLVHELSWGLARSRAGHEPTSDVLDRWLHPMVQAHGLARLQELTSR